MKIKTRILVQTLTASLILTLILTAVFFLSIIGIRDAVLDNSGELGDSAADIGAYSLEVQLTEKIDGIVRDTALILEERLNKIENHTRMTADITGSLYTTRRGWSPRPLPQVRPDEMPPSGAYQYMVPGVDAAAVRAEAELAGNAADMLRQITVVDRGIATCAVSGESGYTIVVDTVPWPTAAYDPRGRLWYTGTKEAGGPYWTDVYEDNRGRGPAITCGVPFFDESGGGRVFRGVARSTVLLTDLPKLIDSSGSGGRFFILNRDGVKIYSSDGIEVTIAEDGTVIGERFLINENLRSLGQSMTLGASGLTELVMDGVPVYVAYAPIRTLGWSLGVTVPIQEVSASAALIENQILKIADDTKASINRYILLLIGTIALLLLVIMIGIALAAVRFTAAITGPILALNEGVHEVASGNLEREVTVNTDDELEELSQSFNMMTSRLRKYIADEAAAAAERQRIDTELEIAKRIQASMLPAGFPPFKGAKNTFDLYAEVDPAKEVGGDFYDFFFIDDNRFAVIVADVSGKGIPAAIFMAITKTIIKDRLQSGMEPEQALEIINKQLCDNNLTDMFVTVWLCVLDISAGYISYVNAGHTPPLVKKGDNGFTYLLSPPDFVLAGLNDSRYHSRRMPLNPGDTLFLYTDGIIDAADTESKLYGKERLRSFLNAHAVLPPSELLPALRADIAAFAGQAEQSDDITMLALRIGEKENPGRRVTLRAAVDDLEALTAFVNASLEGLSCPARIQGQIELAAEEIFVNIVNYAYDENAVNHIEVFSNIRQNGDTNTITLTFTDGGRPFNPLEQQEPDISLPLEERETGGLGLLIVKKTMDTIIYSREEGMNRLELSKSWQKEGQ